MTANDRGSEFYEPDEVRAAYLRHRHDGIRSPNLVLEEPAFIEAVGSIAGQRVLDLGCGDGTTAALMVRAGGTSYVGVDGSAGMVEDARRNAANAATDFVVTDIEDFEADDAEFDIVVSRMALHYVEDLDSVVERVRRWLPTGGRLILSVVHPVITSHDDVSSGPRTTWTVDDYFERGPRARAWFGSTAVWQHRTTEDYVRVIIDHGFRLDTLSECEPRAELFGDDPGELRRRRRVPLMLLLGATKMEHRR